MSIVVTVPLLLLNVASAAPTPAPLTLQHALGIALQSQGNVVSARAAITQAGGQRLSALAGFLPSLSVSDQAQRYDPIGRTSSTTIAGSTVAAERGFFDNAATAQLDWNLFDGGKDAAGLRSAEAGLRAAKAGLVSTVNNTLVQVLKAYEALYKDQAIIAAQNRIILLDGEIAHLTALRYRHRIASRIDWIQAEQQTLQAETQLAQDQQQEASDTEALQQAMGDRSSLLSGRVLTYPLPEGPQNATFQAPADASPDVRAAYAKLEASRAKVGVARAGYLPTVSLVAQFNWLGIDENSAVQSIHNTKRNNYAVGLELKIPLLPALNTAGAIQSAEAGVQDSIGAYGDAQARFESRRLAVRRIYAVTLRNYRLTEGSLKLAKENERLTSDLLAGRQSNRLHLDQARLARIQAQLAHTTAKSDLDLVAWRRYRAARPWAFATRLLAAARSAAKKPTD